jgi:hypothetical protein
VVVVTGTDVVDVVDDGVVVDVEGTVVEVVVVGTVVVVGVDDAGTNVTGRYRRVARSWSSSRIENAACA